MIGLARFWISALASGIGLALVATLGLPAYGGIAYAQGSTKRFEWPNDIRSGDCTMFHGASWTLSYDGGATFDGTVTSSSKNDAWLMHAQLQSADGGYLGNIIAQQPGVDDIGRFVMNLPDHTRQYRWHIQPYKQATFNPSLFGDVKRINLQSHC